MKNKHIKILLIIIAVLSAPFVYEVGTQFGHWVGHFIYGNGCCH